VVLLTESGRRVMRGELAARVALPPRRAAPAPAQAVAAPSPPSAPGRGRSARAAEPEATLDAAAASRFEALRRWRLETARRHGVPPYVVASDRTLRDVARLRPRDREELLRCHGIGAAKAERYGAALVRVVAGGP
jgi:ATP-dependent DNA helicase RecQ